MTNGLLQLFDWWGSEVRESLLVATSNLTEAMDEAILDRFEAEYIAPMPTAAELRAILGVDCTAAQGRMNFRQAARLVLQSKRLAVLQGRNYVEVIEEVLRADFGDGPTEGGV